MSAPQGPGWWQAADGRWYPPPPPYQQQPHYAPGPAPQFAPNPQYPGPNKSSKSWVVPVLIVVGILLVGGIGAAWWILSKIDDAVSDITGGTDLECPTGAEISSLLGANVSGPTAAPEFFVAAACYYEPASPDDVYEVIIVSGAKLVADEQIESMKSEGTAAGASPFSIDVGTNGFAWASSTKSSAIAVGDEALVSVEVQGKNFAEIPDESDAAIAILDKVLY